MPEFEGELGYEMLGHGRGFGASGDLDEQGLGYQLDIGIIRFKAKAKLW